jgi:hypothetical protein
MIVIEQTIDENTGLDCWLIVNTTSYQVLDRCFDAADARDLADYYSDLETDPYEYFEEND